MPDNRPPDLPPSTNAPEATVRPRETIFFRLLLIASVAFLLTVLMMVAATFSESGSPMSRLFDHHGLRILGIEVALVIGCGLAAMIADRRQTLKSLRELEDSQADGQGNSSSSPTSRHSSGSTSDSVSESSS